jgi:hypothetical protein
VYISSFVLRPNAIVGAALTSNSAEMTGAASAPNMKSFVCAIRQPNSATPSTLTVCRAELSTPAATPERDFSTLPRSAGRERRRGEGYAAAHRDQWHAQRPIAGTPFDAQHGQAPCSGDQCPPQRSLVRQIARPVAAQADSPARDRPIIGTKAKPVASGDGPFPLRAKLRSGCPALHHSQGFQSRVRWAHRPERG